MSIEADKADVRRLLTLVVQDPRGVADLSVGDLDLALRVTRRARLLGRLADALETDVMAGLPQVAVDQLLSAQTMAASRTRLALWELDRIERAMRENGSIPLVLMKGTAYVLLGLPNARGRVFADVDLLTSEHELGEVERVLNSAGWKTGELSPYDQNYYRNWTHELPPLVHGEREVEIDLHHNVVPRTARLKPASSKLLERATSLDGSRYQVLCNEDILLHTMTHLMFDSDLADKIRDLVDIRDIAEHFSAADPQFWTRFCERAAELDLTRPAFYSVRYCCRFLRMSVPDEVAEKIERWAPPAFIVRLMDAIVPDALYPQHPDRTDSRSRLSRLALFIRSHWIRMPPWLLVYHLSYKFVATRLRRNPVQD